jgi:hypothetical protein
MDRDGKLRLELLDVYQKPLAGKVDIELRHQVLTDVRVIRNQAASKKILIPDLYGSPQGLYRVEVAPDSYFTVTNFVNLKSSGITDLQIIFPINPKKVKDVKFPTYADVLDDGRRILQNGDAVLGYEGKQGEKLYDALDAIRRAGLLNIITKTQHTILSNGSAVLSYIQKLSEVRGDRFFSVVPKQLRQETKNSVVDGRFHEADESLHTPPPGYDRAGSFKTSDHYGNLQLSFFLRGDDCVVDIDIDDAAGIEHVFQVLKNHFSGQPTHPYNIHEILVYYQKLDPGYSFVI